MVTLFPARTDELFAGPVMETFGGVLGATTDTPTTAETPTASTRNRQIVPLLIQWLTQSRLGAPHCQHKPIEKTGTPDDN
jgi:hypothetical protein